WAYLADHWHVRRKTMHRVSYQRLLPRMHHKPASKRDAFLLYEPYTERSERVNGSEVERAVRLRTTSQRSKGCIYSAKKSISNSNARTCFTALRRTLRRKPPRRYSIYLRGSS